MKPQSAKGKGRRLQQEIVRDLMQIGAQYGLQEGDLRSCSMGANGVDVILSPAAKRLFNLVIECKNRESLNVPTVFIEHYGKYEKDDGLKLLVHHKNHSPNLVTLRWDDFKTLLSMIVAYENDGSKVVQGFKSKVGKK